MITRPRMLVLEGTPMRMVDAAFAYRRMLDADPDCPPPEGLPSGAAVNIRTVGLAGGLLLEASDMRFGLFHVVFAGDPHAYPIRLGAPLGDGFACSWGLLTLADGVTRLRVFPPASPDGGRPLRFGEEEMERFNAETIRQRKALAEFHRTGEEAGLY